MGARRLCETPALSSLLLRALAARAAFQRRDLKPYPSKFMKYSACVRVDLWTFTFYLSAMQLASPFPSLKLTGSKRWRPNLHCVMERSPAKRHGKITPYLHDFLAVSLTLGWHWKYWRVWQGLEMALQIKAHFAWCGWGGQPRQLTDDVASLQVMVPGRRGDRNFLQEWFEVFRVSRVCGSQCSGWA